MTQRIVKPARPAVAQGGDPKVQVRNAPQDATLRDRGPGELLDRDLDKVSGGASISKSQLIKLQK